MPSLLVLQIQQQFCFIIIIIIIYIIKYNIVKYIIFFIIKYIISLFSLSTFCVSVDGDLSSPTLQDALSFGTSNTATVLFYYYYYYYIYYKI